MTEQTETKTDLTTSNKKTVGAASYELQQKEVGTRSPIELQQEMHKKYEEEVWACVDRNKEKFEGNFFIVVITKKEKLMHNVLRNYFFARSSCPSPDWDQTVYEYVKSDDALDFLWVIPSRDTCELFRRHRAEIAAEEKWLLAYIDKFHNGDLLKISKKKNNEQEETLLLNK